MKKITVVAGARPNFIKISPLLKELDKLIKNKYLVSYRLVHTGQHYDKNMSENIFKQLNIPNPTVNLECSGKTHSEQTASIMINFEKELQKYRPDMVVVVGDVNSTMSCTIVAKKLNIKVAHVEAGIRSYDWKMPEEINRIVTDSISDYYFTTTKLASENLIRQGINKENIFFVGNTMIDTLNENLSNFKKPDEFDLFSLSKGNYFVITLHRPSNVDSINIFKERIDTIIKNTSGKKLVFPMHPRTQKIFKQLNINNEKLCITKPLGYLEFNYLVYNSLGVITDSGGITEETTVMNIPCITLRDSTERPETISLGTNELVGNDNVKLSEAIKKIMNKNWKHGSIPELWDGKTSNRIIDVLVKLLLIEKK